MAANLYICVYIYENIFQIKFEKSHSVLMHKPDILVNTKQQSHLIINIGTFYNEEKRILLYRFLF